jgi:hypothetical protein
MLSGSGSTANDFLEDDRRSDRGDKHQFIDVSSVTAFSA